MKNSPYLNARLSDICIGTSAAPTYLPPHYFKNEDGEGNIQEFNLIDGGVAANNPVYFNYFYNFIFIKCLHCYNVINLTYIVD